VNLRLRTRDLQCRRVIDFYLANIGKESIFKGVVVYDAVVGEYFKTAKPSSLGLDQSRKGSLEKVKKSAIKS